MTVVVVVLRTVLVVAEVTVALTVDVTVDAQSVYELDHVVLYGAGLLPILV